VGPAVHLGIHDLLRQYGSLEPGHRLGRPVHLGSQINWDDLSTSVVWGDRFIWGSNIVWGDNLLGVDDGTQVLWGDRFIWGTVSPDRFIWGSLDDGTAGQTTVR
jgi:hypothetical protein